MNEELAIKGTYKFDKICRSCGHKMQYKSAQLRRHCDIHHFGWYVGFLKHGEVPFNSKYLNFEKYVAGIDAGLKEDPDHNAKKAGRPLGSKAAPGST